MATSMSVRRSLYLTPSSRILPLSCSCPILMDPTNARSASLDLNHPDAPSDEDATATSLPTLSAAWGNGQLEHVQTPSSPPVSPPSSVGESEGSLTSSSVNEVLERSVRDNDLFVSVHVHRPRRSRVRLLLS